MDVPPALLLALEPRLLMLSSDPDGARLLEQWLQPLALPVDAGALADLAGQPFALSHHKVILLQAPRAAREQVSDWVRHIRLANSWSSVMVMLIGSIDASTRQHIVHAGADHVLRVPSASAERATFYLQLFQNPDYWNLDPPVLDPARLCLQNADQRLDLTFVQVQTLLALLYAPDHLMSFDDLAVPLGLNARSYDMRVMEKFFSRLRNAIRKAFAINVIQNVRGAGYRLTRGSIATAPIALRS
jgi:DNA-binding response OmpR family regulator